MTHLEPPDPFCTSSETWRCARRVRFCEDCGAPIMPGDCYRHLKQAILPGRPRRHFTPEYRERDGTPYDPKRWMEFWEWHQCQACHEGEVLYERTHDLSGGFCCDWPYDGDCPFCACGYNSGEGEPFEFRPPLHRKLRAMGLICIH